MTNTLAERLAALERAHRRLRRVTLALGAILAAGVLAGAGAASDAILKGRTLQLVDAEGRMRILANAASGLSFLGADGKVRAILGLDGEDTPGLVLYGNDSRAILNVTASGPALSFTGSGGALRAIFATVDGDPGLVLYDAEQRERARIALRTGSGQIALLGPDGMTRWSEP